MADGAELSVKARSRPNSRFCVCCGPSGRSAQAPTTPPGARPRGRPGEPVFRPLPRAATGYLLVRRTRSLTPFRLTRSDCLWTCRSLRLAVCSAQLAARLCLTPAKTRGFFVIRAGIRRPISRTANSCRLRWRFGLAVGWAQNLAECLRRYRVKPATEKARAQGNGTVHILRGSACLMSKSSIQTGGHTLPSFTDPALRQCDWQSERASLLGVNCTFRMRSRIGQDILNQRLT